VNPTLPSPPLHEKAAGAVLSASNSNGRVHRMDHVDPVDQPAKVATHGPHRPHAARWARRPYTVARPHAASENRVHGTRWLSPIENSDGFTGKTARCPSPSRRPCNQPCLPCQPYPSTGAQYALLASRIAKPIHDGFNRRSTSFERLDVHARDTREKFDGQRGSTTRFGHQLTSV
jgi:hypothetical protein